MRPAPSAYPTAGQRDRPLRGKQFDRSRLLTPWHHSQEIAPACPVGCRYPAPTASPTGRQPRGAARLYGRRQSRKHPVTAPPLLAKRQTNHRRRASQASGRSPRCRSGC